MYLVAGLGNPGIEFQGTRHNAGFDTIDYISNKLSFDISKSKFKGIMGEANVSGEKVIFLKPMTYMNLSGDSIVEAANFYKIPDKNIIVIYDDIALEVGRIRIKPSGSAGGHNGMKSIIYRLGSENFPRVRVGIGAPPRGDLINFVTGRFTNDERNLIDEAIKAAGDAAIEIINNGIQSSMNRYNCFNAGQQ